MKICGHKINGTIERLSAAKVDKVPQVPTEDQWFEVNPLDIDQKLFKKKKKDKRQENTRQLILEAFTEVNRNPKKYAKKFKTMMPKMNWEYKKIFELKDLACELGDHMADWVEQALEWAQRVQNGETWEAICNTHDTADWYRVVVWKNGEIRLVGGSAKSKTNYPASDVLCTNFKDNHSISLTVPLVVSYD